MMKRVACVSMAVILTAVILFCTQVQNLIPEQKQKALQDVCGNTAGENGSGNAEENGVRNTEKNGAGNAEDGRLSGLRSRGGRKSCPLTEQEQEILLAYVEYLQKYYEEKPQYADRMKFDLVYIDADDIPELAIIPSETYDHDFVYIYTYHDGNVELAGGFGSYGKCRFRPYANLIFSSHAFEEQAHTGRMNEILIFYRLFGTKCIAQQSFFHHPQYRDDEYIGETYGVDRRLVSEEEYNEAWGRWNVEELDVWGYDDAVLVREVDNLYGEMCRRHFNAVAQGGAENYSGDVTIGWSCQYVQFSGDPEETVLPLPEDLKEADALILKITDGCTPDLSFLEDMSQLTELYITFGPEAELSSLGSLTGLKRLSMSTYGAYAADLSFLRELDQLTEIYADKSEIEDLSFFRHMTYLKNLDLSYLEDVDLNDLANLKNLEELSLAGCNVRNPEGLSGLTQLRTLSLCDISPNARYNGDGRPVMELYPLENLSELERILLYNIHIDDVSPLAGLQNLESICLANTGVEDISPLREMENLSHLDIFGNISEQVKEQADSCFSDLESMTVTEEIPPNL